MAEALRIEKVRLEASVLRALAFIDEPVLELGLRTLFQSIPEIEYHFAHTPDELWVKLEDHSIQVLLWNVTPECNVHNVSRVEQVAPQCKVVLWVHSISLDRALEAVQAGVRGILQRTLPQDVLIKCLHKVACGEVWLDQTLSWQLLAHPSPHLSRREGQLIEALIHGLKNKEIATRLGITENSVKVYVSRLLHKLRLKDRFELALFGLKKNGLLNIEQAVQMDEPPELFSGTVPTIGSWDIHDNISRG